MRTALALAVLLAAPVLAQTGLAQTALAQAPLTGSPGQPTTNAPPLAGTAVAPGPATGPAAATEPPARGTGHGRHGHRPLADRFADADTDHDGSLSLAEARAAKMSEVVRDFGLIDKDKDGSVTVDEIRDFRRARRAARAGSETH